MEKGDKIKDIKNGSIHIIESIESFDDNTVIFTEDSKCLPIDKVKEITLTEEIVETLNKDTLVVEEYIENSVISKFEKHLETCMKKLNNIK